MFANVRPCRKHYIIRSNGVPADLPCEQCSAKQALEPPQYVPHIYDETLPIYIWSQKNYLEKIWNDLNFLSENIFLRKALPDLEIEFNPLLLNKKKLGENILDYRDRFNDGKNASDTMEFLRGPEEQVRNIFFLFL